MTDRPRPVGRYTKRAYRFGIANGILFAIGMAFIDPITVLPTFVSRLTDSGVVIGLISAMGMSGWFLPQLIAGNYLQSRPYKRPLYIIAAVLRGTGLLLAVAATFYLAPRHPTVALVAFLLCFTIYAFAGGTSGPAFLDIVAKTVPGNRLGAFFGHREFWGSLGAIGAGALVRIILGSEALPFPNDYALVFALTVCAFVPGWTLFSLISEPPGRVVEAEPIMAFVRSAPAIVRRNDDFRRLLASRVLTGSVAIALPFYMIYCREVLGVAEETAGTYVAIQKTGALVFIPLWAFLNDRRGPRSLLLAVTALFVVSTSVALVASLLPAHPALGRFAFLVVFFPLAAVGAGSFMGYNNYVIAIAPEERRPLYIGIQNTLFAVTGFLPLLGGALVELTSFRVLFATAMTLAAAGFIATIRLTPQEPRSAA